MTQQGYGQNCYDRFLKEGIEAYEGLDFEEALRKFEAAEICSDKPQTDEVEEWVKKTIESRMHALQTKQKELEKALAESDSLRKEAVRQLEEILAANGKRVEALLRNFEDLVNQLDFEKTNKIVSEALALRANPEVSLPAAAELAYFFTEAGKTPAAFALLQQALPLVPGLKTLSSSDTFAYCQAALALLLDADGQDKLEGKYYPVMKPVKGGTFWMGSKDKAGDEDETEHELSLSDFSIAQAELTALQYHLFVTATGIEKPEGNQLGNYPLTYVSWYDALEYCNWLSQQHGYQPVYRISKTEKDPNNKNGYDARRWVVDLLPGSNGYRLPTEAEWEYAAGGGALGRDSDGRRLHAYSGSDDLKQVAWYQDNSESSLHPIMAKDPNELGLYDMSGNVFEWCWDWYDKKYYVHCKRQGVVNDPIGPESGSLRIYRGGSWSFFAEHCRVADRDDWVGDNPGEQNDIMGFRPARTP